MLKNDDRFVFWPENQESNPELHKWYWRSHCYASNYVKRYNYKKHLMNILFEKLGYEDYKLRTLSIIFWIDQDLSKENALGTYTHNGVSTDDSITGLIKIDLNAHMSFEEVKHTIRHEITHGIAHQIFNCPHYSHCDLWQKIAQKHDVDISPYI